MMNPKTIKAEADRIVESFVGERLKKEIVKLALKAVEDAIQSMLKRKV